jgi:hypothetical protein
LKLFAKVSTAESYVNTLMAVPVLPVTIGFSLRARPVPGATEHRTYVVDVHDVVAHAVRWIITLGVVSVDAKLEPLIVSKDMPVVGPLVEAASRLYAVNRGASKLKSFTPVPTCTSTFAMTAVLMPLPLGLMQARAVIAVQLDVVHAESPIFTVGVASQLPKLAPSTETAAPQLVGPL